MQDLVGCETPQLITRQTYYGGYIGIGIGPHRDLDIAALIGRREVVRRRLSGLGRGLDDRIAEVTPRPFFRTPQRQPSGAGALERWLRVSAPEDPVAWRTTLERGAATGAAGVLVPMGPRLLDELRRPQEEDHRSDLLLSQG